MNLFLYAHTGSKNHGCEAIVRSTSEILNFPNMTLLSFQPSEDRKYKVDDVIKVEDGSTKDINGLGYVVCEKLSNLLGYKEIVFNYLFRHYCRSRNDLYMSIGGDNYCYDSYEWLSYLNKKAKKNKCKTVLWGCSIEPKLMNKKLKKDLQRYNLITARESITYNALIKLGLGESTRLYPDPAFVLDKVELELPDKFVENNTIGINVSPLIMKYENKKGITLKNYEELIQHIINTTDMQIALIPHVVWKDNDDRLPLRKLYSKFKDTNRVVMIEDHNCMELKGFISRCRMFIGARTHATIAAYSTYVPTLVIGYSVKAKGIAKDIFGTYKNYVLPVQMLENKKDLINAFEWLKINEKGIKDHLYSVMPQYCERAYGAAKEIEKVLN